MSKKYDVGILGVWSGCNYGSIATYYALHQVIASMGKSILMIDKPILSENDVERKETHARRFGREHYHISKQYRLEDLKKLNELCDGFVIGSDQVWNYGISRNFGKMFYLDFAEEQKKKIAYAVSFGHGVDFAPAEERVKIADYMSRFDGISVREADGVRLCRDDYGILAKQVLDPVFLADPSIYQGLIEKSSHREEEPFLASYILDPTPEKREALLHLSKELGGIKIVNMLDGLPWLFEKNRKLMNLPNCVENLQVEDWLYYLSHAKFVVTDSCHGASFALIFKRNFIAITNKKRGYSRFKSLAELMHFESHLVTDVNQILTDKKLLEPLDYAAVEATMLSERSRCYTWLQGILNQPKKSFAELKVENVIGKPNPNSPHAIPTLNRKPIQKKSISAEAITSNLPVIECAGCGACVSTCPVKALELKPDEHGLYRAVLNEKTCINCGKCLKVCPSYRLPSNANTTTPNCYAVIASDAELLKKSSSGGVFSLLAKKAFEQQGAVGGAAWKEDLSVEHILIDQESDMPKLRKSKYLQSYLGNIDAQVKKRLQQGQFVLFSGCPCQIAGLRAYLGKDYENLITIDLLCGNSPSAGFFQKYLQDAFGDQVASYEFRNKAQGWNSDCVSIQLKSGEQIIRRGKAEDAYQSVYHNHTMCPPHCQNCKYQQLPRFGDITIGDFWGISKRMPEFDYTKGVSVVICNNEKGQAFFDQISEQEFSLKKEVPLKWIGGNGYALEGKHNYASPYRDAFFDKVRTEPFAKAVKLAFDQQNLGAVPSEFLNPLQFHSQQIGFQYDLYTWEQHLIQGRLVLIPKEQQPKPGNYASMPLAMHLQGGKRYHLFMRFKIQTESQWLNLHIKEAGSKRLQVIHRHRVQPNDAKEWVTISKDFVPNNDIYSEFMVGAMQIAGEGRFLAIDYLYITEAKP